MPQRIYLDTNHWIALSRVHHGLESDPTLCTLYEQLDCLSKDGRIVVPFSIFTAIEASRYRKPEEYRNLVDVLVGLSRGYVLKPSSYFLDKEVENALDELSGERPAHDIRSEIIGRGPADMINYTVSDIKRDSPLHRAFRHLPGYSDNDLTRRFNALRDDTNALKAALTNEDLLSGVREAYVDAEGLIRDAESERHISSGMGKGEFERRLIAHDLNSLVDKMSVWAVRRGIPRAKIRELLTGPNIERFRRLMPAHHTRFTLAWARDKKASRLYKPNDLLDIAHLAVAIPYADTVVTDKMAAYLATSEELDKLYGCIVLDDLKKLAALPPFKQAR